MITSVFIDRQIAEKQAYDLMFYIKTSLVQVSINKPLTYSMFGLHDVSENAKCIVQAILRLRDAAQLWGHPSNDPPGYVDVITMLEFGVVSKDAILQALNFRKATNGITP